MTTPWLVMMSGWVSRSMNVASRLLFMVWLLNYLGTEQYAVFAVISSLEGWFLLSDWGVGSSAQNAISQARASHTDGPSLRESIAQLSLLCAALSLGIIVCLFPALNTFLFKKLPCSAYTCQALCVGGIAYCLLAVGTVAYRVLYAEQRGYLVHLLQAVAVGISVLATGWLVRQYSGDHKMVYACLCTIGAQAVVAMVAFFVVFRFKFLVAKWNLTEIGQLFVPAWRFFAFGLGGIAVLGIDYMVLVRHVDAQEVITYHLISRLFTGFFVLHGTFLQAVWPVCSAMAAASRFGAVRALLKRCCVYGALFVTVVSGMIAVGSSTFCHVFFSQQALYLPLGAILLFGCYYLIRSLCDPYAMALQSVNQLNPLLISVPLQAALSFTCQVLLVQVLGFYGVILGLMCSYLLTVSWILPRFFYRWLNRREYAETIA